MRVRRTGMCAAFALVCSLYSSAAWGVYEREFVNMQDFSAGSREGLTFISEMGGLTLSNSTNIVPFVWAPSPAQSTVSKIDARTGVEIARYRIGPASEHWAPTAVAPDADGNVFVACSAPNQRAKIVMILTTAAFDRNKDNVTATSGDYDTNGYISPTEILRWGADEKVGFVCEVGLPGATPSGIICDNCGNLWVTLNEQRRIAKIDIKTGETIGMTDVVGKPSTLAMGLKGSIWVLSTENCAITEIDTQKCAMASYTNLEFTPGGMCVDSKGTIWIGNTAGGLASLNTTNGNWADYGSEAAPGVTNVALDANEDIWAACPGSATVTHFSAIDGSVMSKISLGKPASCVGSDADGCVWALCDNDTSAFKIDTRAEKILSVAQTGYGCYSGTPFASSVTEKGFLPSGCWRTVLDSKLEGAGWGKISWKSSDDGGRVKFVVRTADNPNKLMEAPFKNAINGAQFGGPNGRYIEVRAILEGPGNCTPTLYALRVEGTNLAPDISKAKVNCPRIGRLDHVMESIAILDVKDPEGDPFKVVVTGVTQDEPNVGLGPEDKGPDAILTGGNTVWLRGECDPGTPDKPGNGRVYTVAFKATDSLGAVSTGKLKVTVAPTIKTTDVAIEDKEHYDSTKEIFKNVAKAD